MTIHLALNTLMSMQHVGGRSAKVPVAALTTMNSTAVSRSGSSQRPLTSRSRLRSAITSTGYGGQDIICAISESRGLAPTVGLSFVNLGTAEAVLCQFIDTQTYARACHKIAVFSPSDIVYMSTATESNLVSVILENIVNHDNEVQMHNVDRKYWNESSGYESIQKLAFPSDSDALRASAGGNYFATCCFSAVTRSA
jgi:DNA mismatch repair protein MSH4